MAIFDGSNKGKPENPWDKLQSGVNLPKFPHIKLPSLGIIILILLGLWLASGIFVVGPDEQGVVRRFGKLVRLAEPGIGWHFPSPIEVVDVPKITEVKRIEIGFRTIDPGPPARYRDVLPEALMLTGDENIISVQFVVQYMIKDAAAYLFNVRDVDGTVRNASEAAMREVIGETNIDEALTVAQARIQDDVQQLLQQILDSYAAGLKIALVQLQEVKVPEEVIHAFEDVVNAKKDKKRLINEARGYREDVLPKARGRAAQIIKQARAYQDKKIKHALGDANKFLQILKEYRKAKKITRKRLFIETMEEILPQIEKVIVDKNVKGGVLPLLQLKPAGKSKE
jgi:membrane protease subunit HflK